MENGAVQVTSLWESDRFREGLKNQLSRSRFSPLSPMNRPSASISEASTIPSDRDT